MALRIAGDVPDWVRVTHERPEMSHSFCMPDFDKVQDTHIRSIMRVKAKNFHYIIFFCSFSSKTRDGRVCIVMRSCEGVQGFESPPEHI